MRREMRARGKGRHVDIGHPKRIIEVEPIELPLPEELPEPERIPEPEPAEPTRP